MGVNVPDQQAEDWQPDSGGEARVQGHSDGWAALADASWSSVSSAVGGGGGGEGGGGAGMTEVVPPAPSSPAPSSTEAAGPGREGDGPPPLEPIEPAGVDDGAEGHEVEGDPRGESDENGPEGGGRGSARTSFLQMLWRSKWRLAATWGEGFLLLTTLSLLLLLVVLHQTFIGGNRCLGNRPAVLARGKQDLIEVKAEPSIRASSSSSPCSSSSSSSCCCCSSSCSCFSSSSSCSILFCVAHTGLPALILPPVPSQPRHRLTIP